jgi:AcrR family transcriptional regulator
MDKASRKRAEIIEAAYRVFSERGYHSTRIEDIARETGMAQGLFYRYFENKLDIFSQIMDDIIARITAGVMSDAPGTANTLAEYAQQMTRALENLFEIFVDDPFISKLLFYEALGIDDDINRKIQEAQDLFAGYSTSYIKDGIKKGFLRPDIQVKESAYAFNALVFEGARRIVQSEDKRKAKRYWTKAIVDLMVKGTAQQESLD